MEFLNADLQTYIQENNWRIEQEMVEWEEQQSCKMAQRAESESSVESQYFSTDSGQGERHLLFRLAVFDFLLELLAAGQTLLGAGPFLEAYSRPRLFPLEASPPSEHGVCTLSAEHAMISKDQTAQAIANAADAYEKNGVEAALVEVRTTCDWWLVWLVPLPGAFLACSLLCLCYQHLISEFLVYLSVSFILFFDLLLSPLLLVLPQSEGAEPAKEFLEDADLATQVEEQQDPVGVGPAAPALPDSQVSEVEIPSVGKILVRSDADGYDEEVGRRGPPAPRGVLCGVFRPSCFGASECCVEKGGR